MKKKVVYSLIGVILVIVLILSIFTIKSEKISKDEKRFKSEYERFNGTKNLSGVSYLSIEVPENIYKYKKSCTNFKKWNWCYLLWISRKFMV